MEKTYHIMKLGTGMAYKTVGDPIATVKAMNHSRALKAHFGDKAKVRGHGSNAMVADNGYWNIYVAREVKA